MTQEKMNREEAIAYLKRKDRWLEEEPKPKTKEEIAKENEESIKEVMKEGKIYGDPYAEIQW